MATIEELLDIFGMDPYKNFTFPGKKKPISYFNYPTFLADHLSPIEIKHFEGLNKMKWGSLQDKLDYKSFIDNSIDNELPDRDDLFKEYTDPRVIARGAVQVFLLYPQKPDPLLQEYESAFARNTSTELSNRGAYVSRNREVLRFAQDQIMPQTGRQPLSVGVENLLHLAFAHVSGLSDEKLREYRAQGCDVHYALLREDPFHLATAISETRSYINTLDMVERKRVGYSAENAFRVIRAFVSIAEYERFCGGIDAKLKQKKEQKNYATPSCNFGTSYKEFAAPSCNVGEILEDPRLVRPLPKKEVFTF